MPLMEGVLEVEKSSPNNEEISAYQNYIQTVQKYKTAYIAKTQ